jgi:hypothetical protein
MYLYSITARRQKESAAAGRILRQPVRLPFSRKTVKENRDRKKTATGYAFPFSCPSAKDSAVCTALPASPSGLFRGRPVARGSSTRRIFRPSSATNSCDPSGLRKEKP